MVRIPVVVLAVVAAIAVTPASAAAATLRMTAPALGDMSVTATTVLSAERPSLRVIRAGAADLVVAAVARQRTTSTVVVAAFNRPGTGPASTAATLVGVSPRAARLAGTVAGASLFSGRSPTCTNAQVARFENAYRGRFSVLRGTLPSSLPSGIRPALLAKFAADELCGSSFEQQASLRRFAWNVAPNAHLPVTAGATQTWAPGASSGRLCVHVATNPPQPGAAVQATVAPVRGRSYSGTGTLGADGSGVVQIAVGAPGDYDLQLELNGTPVSGGFLLSLPGPQYGRTASSCP